MQAIILAAGMGRRLKNLTSTQAKCMVKVNNVPMIERMLKQIEVCRLERIVLVVGHQSAGLKEFIGTLGIETPIEFVENPVYETTNNIYSLYLAKEHLMRDDTILLESDLIFEQELLQQLMSDPYPNLALVARFESWMDGTVVVMDEQRNITNFLTRKDFRFEDIKKYHKTINIYKFSKEFLTTHYVPFLEAYSKALGNNEYYEQVLKVISLLDDHGLKALELNEGFWYEIDDEQDLDIAESIFTDSQSRLEKLSRRYGGYWRYPSLLDFCYLVNPYFPNERLMGEIKANFEQLLISYPSGLEVNNLLAAKSLGLRPEQVLVGNGASELISVLMAGVDGKVGVLSPSFEEYRNRAAQVELFEVANRDFTYQAADLMNYYQDRDIQALVLVNPDNPSGNYIPKSDVELLTGFCRDKNALFILDESFVDFADEPGATMLEPELLETYQNLVVIKSISKSYGVPGLRLGLLASGNRKLLIRLRSQMPIWNINSFGEYFLQIFEKYEKDYRQALVRFREERRYMYEELKLIRQLRVIPSQANFMVCEILDGASAQQIAELLLNRYNILVKDLSKKDGMMHGNYIRIAVKTRTENNRLIEALKHILR
ncbi:MAG: aminotransferase class I/II-fold pyridoxal phosphate-dependent enzyme [Lachnospiraceae bacterium]